MTEYRPVDCDTHSRYEEAVVLRRRLRLKWRTDEGEVREALVRPLDVVTRNKEEFLVSRTVDEKELLLRLDHIISSEQE